MTECTKEELAIAKVFDCEPTDSTDLLEACRELVSARDTVAADNTRLRALIAVVLQAVACCPWCNANLLTHNSHHSECGACLPDGSVR